MAGFGASAAVSALEPSPEAIREAAARITSSEPYDLESASRYLSVFSRVIQWLIDWIRLFFDWLDSFLGDSPPWVTYAVIGVLSAVLIALLGKAVYAAYRSLQGVDQGPIEFEVAPRPDLDALVRRAGELASQGNYVDASRTLYRAALILLEERRGGRVLTGLTNSEYLRTFHTPWVVENLRVFADLINWKWYRDKSFDADDYAQCRSAFEAIHQHLQES